MARKWTFDHVPGGEPAGQSRCDRLTGTYPIVTLSGTVTPYGQHQQARQTLTNPGRPRVNVAPKRTFDHGRSPEIEGVIRRAAILVYAAFAVIALALLVGVFHHDAQPPADPGTPANVTTTGGGPR